MLELKSSSREAPLLDLEAEDGGHASASQSPEVPGLASQTSSAELDASTCSSLNLDRFFVPDATFRENVAACQSGKRLRAGRTAVKVGFDSKAESVKVLGEVLKVSPDQDEGSTASSPRSPKANRLKRSSTGNFREVEELGADLEIHDRNLPIHFVGQIFDDKDFAVFSTTFTTHHGEVQHMPQNLHKSKHLRHHTRSASELSAERSRARCWQRCCSPDPGRACTWPTYLFSLLCSGFTFPEDGLLKDRLFFQADNPDEEEVGGSSQSSFQAPSGSALDIEKDENKYVARVVYKGSWVAGLAEAVCGAATNGIDLFNNVIYIGPLWKGGSLASSRYLLGFFVTWVILLLEQCLTCFRVAENDMYRVPNSEELGLKVRPPDRSSADDCRPTNAAQLEPLSAPTGFRRLMHALGFGGADATTPPAEQKDISSPVQKGMYLFHLYNHFILAFFMVPSTLTDLPTLLHPRGQIGRLFAKNGARLCVLGNWHSEHHEDCDRIRFHHRTLPSALFVKGILVFWQLGEVFANGINVPASTYIVAGFKLVLMVFKIFRWLRVLHWRISLRHYIVARWGSALRRRSLEVLIEMKPGHSFKEIENRVKELLKKSLKDRITQEELDHIKKRIRKIKDIQRCPQGGPLIPCKVQPRENNEQPESCKKCHVTLERGTKVPLGCQVCDYYVCSACEKAWRSEKTGDLHKTRIERRMVYLGTTKSKFITTDEEFRENLAEEWREAEEFRDEVKRIQSETNEQLVAECRTGKDIFQEDVRLNLSTDPSVDISAFPILNGTMPAGTTKENLAVFTFYGWTDLVGVYVGMYLQHFADLKVPVRERRWLLLAEIWVPRHRVWMWSITLLVTAILYFGPEPMPILLDFWSHLQKLVIVPILGFLHLSSPSSSVAAASQELEKEAVLEQFKGVLSSAPLAINPGLLSGELQKMSAEALHQLLHLVSHAQANPQP